MDASPEFRDHIVFIENYDMQVARRMLQGSDVWLNTPRRPLEASGTSGMKAAVNGALNVSVLDGWWCEGFGESNGWVIGSGEVYDDPKLQDDIESDALYRLLENDIIPLFYDRDRAGLPRDWIKMMKASMKALGSFFNTHRMLIDYTTKLYLPASNMNQTLSNDGYSVSRDLASWRKTVAREWSNLDIKNSRMSEPGLISIGDVLKISADVDLGSLNPPDVEIEAWWGKLNSDDQIIDGEILPLKALEQQDGRWLYEGELIVRFNGRCGFAIRVIPHRDQLVHPYTPPLMKWE